VISGIRNLDLDWRLLAVSIHCQKQLSIDPDLLSSLVESGMRFTGLPAGKIVRFHKIASLT
jgi:hypothetical protein